MATSEITLPEVVVTPENKPPPLSQGLEGGAEPGIELSRVPAHDAMATARIMGHSWADISDFHRNFSAMANDNGYTPEQSRQYLGWPDQAPFLARSTDQWRNRLETDPKLGDALKLPDPEADLGDAARNRLSGDWLRGDYARAMQDGHADSPEDFARNYLSTLAGQMGDDAPPQEQINRAAAGLAKDLPSLHDMTDAALIVTQQHGGAFDPKAIATTRNNLFDLWAQTGIKPAQISDDPLMGAAVSAPVNPHEPTMAEYQEALKNARPDLYDPNKDAVYDPIGNMKTDPTGLVGQAQGLIDLVPASIEHMKKVRQMELDGRPESEILTAMMDSPAIKFLAQGLIFGALGKAAGAVKRSVAEGPLGELWRDEAGTVPVGPPQPEHIPEGAEPKPETTPEQYRAAATAAIDKLGKKRALKTPELPPPPGMGDIKPIVTGIEDDLNRLRTNAVADKIELTKLVAGLPKQWRTGEFQEHVANEVEQRLVKADVKLSPEATEFLAVVKPLTDRQTELGRMIRDKLDRDMIEITDPMIDNIRSVDEGYMHRIVKAEGAGAEGSALDPNLQQEVITGARPRTLSTFASGMQHRQFYVLDDGHGNRVWGHKSLDEIGEQMGNTVTDVEGTEWRIKQATMAEVEANTKVQYHKNFMTNTVENVARLERVNRNLDFLHNQADELAKQGLFVHKNAQQRIAPEGMIEVHVPQMQGWAVPKIANIINDFFDQDKSDFNATVAKINRFLIGSLFVTPIPHAMNVGTMATIARGWSWVTPRGWGSLMLDGAKAVHEVYTLGPRYVEHLREGSGLQYGSVETENFYNTIMHKMFNEQMADEKTWGAYARSFGFEGVKDLVQAEYRWSRKELWRMNDIFMLQRQFELERRGLPVREAIRQAERDIANYRVPTEVMGSHAMSQFLQDPTFMAFGRYRYGQIGQIARIVHDIVGPGVKGSARFEAIGKATVGVAVAMGAFALLNAGLQSMLGPNARFLPSGPFSLVSAVYGWTTGQKDWVSMIGSLLTLAPAIDILGYIKTGKDIFGRDVIGKGSSTAGKVAESLEAIANSYYPAKLLVTLAKNGPEEVLLNLLHATNKPPYKPTAKSVQYQRREQRGRENHDAFEQWLKQHIPGM